MEEARERFSEAALELLRGAIAGCAGNEVFAVGALEDGLVVDLRVLSRGNRGATPALMQVPRHGEIVVHNHPSGELHPSAADLDIASRLGERGVGFFIVDNRARRVYVVVEPLGEDSEVLLDTDRVTGLLAPDGALADMPGYERREQQLAMLRAVTEAFNDREVLSVEAGTGTGKSFAYLLPAIAWATTNKARVIVSTHTINLQEQLIGKDLPLLAARTGIEFTSALVKGRGNYLCQRKAAQVEQQLNRLFEDDLGSEMRELLAWAKKTKDGSLADLSQPPRPAVWEQVVSESDNSLRARCPFYSTCFFYTARRRAAAADILVVNHHLLLADLALRNATENYSESAVLPPARHLVIDEAHHLEDVATAHFGFRTGLTPLERILGRLQSRRDPSRGVLPSLVLALDSVQGAAETAARNAAQAIGERILERVDGLYSHAEQVFAEITDAYLELVGEDNARAGKLRITDDVRGGIFWRETSKRILALGAAADALALELENLLDRVEPLIDAVPQQITFLLTEIQAQSGRLRGAATALAEFLGDEDSNCRWVELRQRLHRPPLVSFHGAPVEVAELLEKSLFRRFRTAVLTSATLTVDRSFAHLHEHTGIDRVEPAERVRTALIDSPFDYAQQAILLGVSSLPEPQTSDYEEATHEAIHLALRITRGGTFVLFTSYGALNRAHQALARPLSSAGLYLLRQGDGNRHQLLERFSTTPGAVLFATDSFWEGVDVRGDALRCVIIPRLPFTVPTEPIEQARIERLKALGRNAFNEHSLPQAVVKLKQGFGRLIRTRRDRGCVLILDSRLARKHYGQVFLRSLPPARRVIGPAHQVFHAMREFFQAAESDTAARESQIPTPGSRE